MRTPASSSIRALLPCAAVIVALAGCGGTPPGTNSPEWQGASTGGGRVEPSSEAEKQVLAALDELPPGTPKTIGGMTVVADEPYFSASGRACRWLMLETAGAKGGARRLACKDSGGIGEETEDQGSWFFAPNVFAPPMEGK